MVDEKDHFSINRSVVKQEEFHSSDRRRTVWTFLQ